jgi:selenoprotein W-related protein
MAEVLNEFEPEIESFALIPSDGGCFEITVNGELVYSKLQTNRHINKGEAVDLVRRLIKEGS